MTPTAAPTDTIRIADFRQLRREDPDLRVIDVRTGGEFATAHIPGSFNIPLDTLGEHARSLAAVDHDLVLVCQSGRRATQAHTKLGEAGKTRLHVLEGGIEAWQRAGGDVASTGPRRWAMDRQVRLVAGSLVLGGLVASLLVPRAKWFAAAVGGGLVFSAVSDTCAMANVLGRLPYNRGPRCDLDGVIADIVRIDTEATIDLTAAPRPVPASLDA